MTWVGDSELCQLLIWRAPYQSIFFFFLARDREIAPWRSSAEERRHHTPLFSLCSCFYHYGEVCAKNSSKRSSGISAKLLRYVIEQSIDTLGWIGPPLITSTHNFKYCRMLFNVESLYSAYLQNSINYFELFKTQRSSICKWWMLWQFIEIFQQPYILVGFVCVDKRIKSN